MWAGGNDFLQAHKLVPRYSNISTALDAVMTSKVNESAGGSPVEQESRAPGTKSSLLALCFLDRSQTARDARSYVQSPIVNPKQERTSHPQLRHILSTAHTRTANQIVYSGDTTKVNHRLHMPSALATYNHPARSSLLPSLLSICTAPLHRDICIPPF